MTQDFDKFLDKIGGFGTYQKRQVFLALVPICFLSCMGIFSSIFLLNSPKTGCNLPKNTAATLPEGVSFENASARMTPMVYNEMFFMDMPSICSLYDYSGSNWTFPGSAPESEPPEPVSCPEGRWWDTADWQSTLVTQFELVCGREWVVSFLYSIGSFGELALLPFTSYAQDNWGRKPTMFLMLAIYFITALCIIWAKSWQLVAALFFIKQGVCHVGFSLSWIIAIEVTSSEYHTIVMIILCIVFSAGSALSVLIAYFTTSHVTFTLGVTIPVLGCFLFYPLLDEPARWYLSHKKLGKARNIMTKMLHQNNIYDQSHMDALLADPATEMDDVPKSKFIDEHNGVARKVPEDEDQSDTGRYGIWHVFSSFNLFFKTITMFVLTFAVVAIYFGLMMNAENIGGGNIYIIQGIGFAVEIPAVIFVQTSNYFGRVWITAGSTLLGGIFCGLVAGTKNVTLMITFCIIAKFWATVAFDVVYMFCGELYPTVIRASGVAAGMLGGAIGGIAAPYIIFGQTVHTLFPMLGMAVLGVVGGIAGMFLPETMDHPMYDRLEDDIHLKAGGKALWNNLTFYYARKRICGSERAQD